MPHFISKKYNLQAEGPVLEVTLTTPFLGYISTTHTSQMKVLAMVDTGATLTSVDRNVARQLGLVPHDRRLVQTSGGPVWQYLYEAGLILPMMHSHTFYIPVLEANLEVQPYKLLLGRDILRHCTLVYHGWENTFSLHA